MNEEEIECPKCHRIIIRPFGAMTLHDCGAHVAATEKK